MGQIRLPTSVAVLIHGDTVVFRSDMTTVKLEGADVRAFVERILPLLDGSRDQGQIAGELREFSAASIAGLLDQLRSRGLIVDGSESEPEGDSRQPQEEFFRSWGGSGSSRGRLKAARVAVVGLEPWGVVAALELASAGVGHLHLEDARPVGPEYHLLAYPLQPDTTGQPRAICAADLVRQLYADTMVTTGNEVGEGEICIPEEEFDLVLSAGSRDDLRTTHALAVACHSRGMKSLYVSVDGLKGILGPLVYPGESACWNCCRLRLLSNADSFDSDRSLQNVLMESSPAPSQRILLGPMAKIVGQSLALEALKYLLRYTPSELVGRILVQNLVTLETSRHELLRFPWCEICGKNEGGAGPPSGGFSRANSANLGDARDVGELRKMLSGLVDVRTGLIRAVEVSSGDAREPALPIGASALTSRLMDGIHSNEAPSIGSGKGFTKVEAMIGAVGEAVERYSASLYKGVPVLRQPARKLSDEYLDPKDLCLYEPDQYKQSGFPYWPYDPEQPLDWVRGKWLDSDELVWVPALVAYFNYQVCHQEQFCQVTSNGLAAGASVEDAMLRAVFELAERDAFMLTWLGQLSARRVHTDEALPTEAQELIRQFAERGVRFEHYLLDLGTPVSTLCSIALGDGDRWPIAVAALAAHSDARVAMRKSILELGHVTPYIRRLMLEDKTGGPQSADEVRTMNDHALYYARDSERLRAFDFLRSNTSGEIGMNELPRTEVLSMREIAKVFRQLGTRLAGVDVTSSDLVGSRFRVARSLGTNMQPIHFGHKLARLANPRLKAALNGKPINPAPHPLA